MKGTCHYCKDETEVEYFEHPVFLLNEPTCEKCKTKFLSSKTYESQRKFMANIGCSVPFLLIISILILLFVSKYVGIIGIGISIFMLLFSGIGMDYFGRKRDENFGIEQPKWCNNCKYYRKVKKWDYELMFFDEMPDKSMIPCKIFEKTRRVWISYFELESSDRTLYPGDCDRWSKK